MVNSLSSLNSQTLDRPTAIAVVLLLNFLSHRSDREMSLFDKQSKLTVQITSAMISVVEYLQLIDVILKLKSQGVFDGEVFSDDVLPGMQAHDSDDLDAICRVWKAVNSPTWYKNICEQFRRAADSHSFGRNASIDCRSRETTWPQEIQVETLVAGMRCHDPLTAY